MGLSLVQVLEVKQARRVREGLVWLVEWWKWCLVILHRNKLVGCKSLEVSDLESGMEVVEYWWKGVSSLT